MKNEITALRLKEALSDLDMKPQELADRSGVSKASISQYLSGSHAPSNISSGRLIGGLSPYFVLAPTSICSIIGFRKWGFKNGLQERNNTDD